MSLYPEFGGRIDEIGNVAYLYDLEEARRRARLMAAARAGDYNAINYLRRGYRVSELVLDGRPLIHEGQVVGARR